MAELDAKLSGPVRLSDYETVIATVSDMERVMTAPIAERLGVVAALIEKCWVDMEERRLVYVEPFAEFYDLLEAACSDVLAPSMVMVETRGLEPLTFALRTRRSPN